MNTTAAMDLAVKALAGFALKIQITDKWVGYLPLSPLSL
jgi:hypothetical protein